MRQDLGVPFFMSFTGGRRGFEEVEIPPLPNSCTITLPAEAGVKEFGGANMREGTLLFTVRFRLNLSGVRRL